KAHADRIRPNGEPESDDARIEAPARGHRVDRIEGRPRGELEGGVRRLRRRLRSNSRSGTASPRNGRTGDLTRRARGRAPDVECKAGRQDAAPVRRVDGQPVT